MRHARPRLGLPVLLLGVVLLSSCTSPKIVQFDADPNQICRDQTTTLSWSVTGDAVLEAEPTIADAGPVDATGSLALAPQTTTRFTLRVTRGGKEIHATQEVVVYDTAASLPLAVSTEPDDATGGLKAVGMAPEHDWDDTLRIARVANTSDRPVIVTHGGRTAELAVGAVSDALADLPYGGTWTLTARLLPLEVIGDPEHAPAEVLRLQVTLTCGE